ncbi:Riboflavin transporter MCH5 [Fusarium odoratissimum]|uniref:Riboflavin transporter MCH5 n=1 Tax=Fusarium oxysporum f. sp. cubense (strain race 4) TaxID=2502994 RepID=N1S6L6_FUSC4|nr:Riboflavin transporter MCH5 [Fusarium odoratissimum]
MIPSMGLLNTLAVLQAWVLENELPHLPESTVGWIFGCYGFFLYFCGAQVGPIFDTHDIKLLVIPGSFGMVLSMVFVSFSTDRLRLAIRVIALINMGSGVLASCLLRKRLPSNKKAGASIDLKALADVKFASTTAAVFLIEFAVFIPYSYISAYAMHYGFNSQKAYLLNTLLNVGAVPGRALPGYVADRFGTFNTMCITSFVCAALILTLWLKAAGEEARTTSFTVLYGFWSGAAISLTPVCISQVCMIEDIGKRTGTAFFIASFGALTGIPIAGAILEASDDSYGGLIVFAGILYISAFATFVLARGIAGGWCWAKLF